MNQKVLIVVLLAVIAGILFIFFKTPVYNPNEFTVAIQTVPATPVDLVANMIGNPLDVEISVNDTIDEPDNTPWTLCGIIAGTPLDSFENSSFSYDVLGSLDPAEKDVVMRQDVNDDSIFFPQGGFTEDTHTFNCIDEGTNDLYFYYMASRVVRDCSTESLRIMQDDPNTEKKNLPLGEVRCIDPNNPPPPKEAGLERSEGIPVGENQGVPPGFEYIGGQTIEIGAEGEFIDQGYQDRGNPQ